MRSFHNDRTFDRDVESDIDNFTPAERSKLRGKPTGGGKRPQLGQRLDVKPPEPRFCSFCGALKEELKRVSSYYVCCDTCTPPRFGEKPRKLFCKDCGVEIPTNLNRGARCVTCADALK